MSFYVTTASGHLRMGIYDASGSGGGPGALKAQTAEFTPIVGWNTQNVVTPTSLPAGTYWLAYLPESSSLHFRVTSSGAGRYYSYTYGTLPNTYSSSPQSGIFHFSFYATLNMGIVASPTVTYTSTNTATFTPTNTTTYTPTKTPVPPTATYTPTFTSTPTNTLIPLTATYTFTPSSTATFTTTNTAIFTPTNTATFTPTNTPVPPTTTSTLPPTGGDVIYISSTSNGTAGTISFNDEDILKYEVVTGTWSMYFDGSDVGLDISNGADVAAFRLMPDGSILFSFVNPITITGLGSVDDSDIVRFTPTSLGENTSGTFSWYFDGSDVGLTTNGEDIDIVGFAPDGRLLISTTGSFSVTGASGNDEDIIAFLPTSLGSTTSGTWSLYFDGSDADLGSNANEDINGASVDPVTGQIYLTTAGNFSVTGVSGTGGDIFVCTPSSLGSNTACTFSMYWVAVEHGFAGETTDGIGIEK